VTSAGDYIRDAAAEVTFTVDLAGLLDTTEAVIRKYVVAEAEQTCALTLGVAHTHAIAAAETTLYFNVTSAAPESGKTRLFEVLDGIVREPFNVTDPSTAALFRMVDAKTSTVLLDEADVLSSGDKEERARILSLINAGYRVGASIPRVLNGGKDERPPKLFKVFSPKFFAGITTGLPASTLSRCAVIRLKRKKAGEQAARLRLRDFKQEARPIREALAEWVATDGVIDVLRAVRPEMPDGLRDRQMDAWEPLFAIADMAGGTWPTRARYAALALSPALDDRGQAVGVRLLHDIREVLLGDEDRIHLKVLAARLNDLEDVGWGGWNDGDGIASREISKHLRPFELEPKQMKIDGLGGKGYDVDLFGDAFERYLDTPVSEDPQILGSLETPQVRPHIRPIPRSRRKRGILALTSKVSEFPAIPGGMGNRTLRRATPVPTAGQPRPKRGIRDTRRIASCTTREPAHDYHPRPAHLPELRPDDRGRPGVLGLALARPASFRPDGCGRTNRIRGPRVPVRGACHVRSHHGLPCRGAHPLLRDGSF
jgi:hypothetical protein